MNANARLTTIPGAKKSRKKGRRDKPFRELRMCKSIMEKLHKRDPKPETSAPKPYVPLVITDFSPPLNPKAAKKVRRKQRRKYQKEMAKWENEHAGRQSKEDAAAEAEAQATRKRKADQDLYHDVTKKSKTGEADSEVDERKKLEPKSRKSKPEPKVKPAPPNDKPEPELGELPVEMLRDIFGYRDSFDRTCIALTCKTFAGIIMQDLLDCKNPPKDEQDAKTTEQASRKGVGGAGKKKSNNEPKNEERNGFNMTAGFPDVRKRYNWDGERHAAMEHLHSSIAPDKLYCHVCRIYKAKNGGTVTSYKNCPKKTLMANKTSPNHDPTTPLPASMIASPKVEKEKPIPDKIVWTEEDWSVIKLGAIRSRMGLVQTCYLCPSCTDSRNNFLFPPPPEAPLERFIEYGNPIGGDLKNGRVPYGQKGPNVRDPRRMYPPEEKLATVEDGAREAGKAAEREERNNG